MNKSSNSMKILMLLDNDYPKDERVEKEAKSLVEAGHSVTILSTNFKKRSPKATIHGVKIIRINISKKLKDRLHPFTAAFPFYTKIWSNYVLELLTSNDFDVLHCHDLPLCSVGHEIKKRIPRIKFIADLHENFPNLIAGMSYMSNPLIRYFVNIPKWYSKETLWLNNCDGLIVTASGMKSRLETSGIFNANWSIIENTIQLDDFIESSEKPDKNHITLFYSGGITVHRGLQYALQGYHLLKNDFPNLRFWIVGAGKYEQTLKLQVAKNNIKDVVFWGWKTQEEMFEIMQKSDVGIIPHLRSEHTNNTSPNKIFHYFRAKKPVLVSDCDYLVEKVKETNAGLYYTDRSPESFADNLSKLIHNRPTTSYGLNGYNAVMNKYNWKVTSKELLSLYQRL